MAEEKDILKEITSQEYEHGFVTDVEQEFIPKGLDEDIIRLISAKKDEPQWLLDFRLDAFRKWKKMKRRIVFQGIGCRSVSGNTYICCSHNL